jgi:hypothetical protein
MIKKVLKHVFEVVSLAAVFGVLIAAYIMLAV